MFILYFSEHSTRLCYSKNFTENIVYNSGKFIEHCLESIAKQDYDNYEIIIINDASTDITGYKICDFQKKHPNIAMQVIYNKQNKG